jgi:hypothetical protein
MLITKKMRDGSTDYLEVDDKQADFLIKHDPVKYAIAEKVEKKVEKEIPDLIIEDVKEDDLY